MKLLPPPSSRRRSMTSVAFVSCITLLAMLLLLALFSLGACSGSHCYKGYDSEYSFDVDAAHNPSWMSTIPDNVNLSSLSIPGTHDTMTYGMPDNIWLQCQNHNLSTQLRAGLRYFDIRGRLVNDTIGIYHSIGYTGYTFTDVVRDMFGFLEENPSEAIIMRLKEEGKPVGDVARDRNRTFEEVFNDFRHTNPETSPGFEKHLFQPETPSDSSSLPAQSNFLPTLGAMRGKILLLQNFSSEEGPYGLSWDSPLMELEDLWVIPSAGHLGEKWDAIEGALDLARESPDDNSALYVAHLSAAVGVLPIEAAAGPRTRKEIRGMNDRTGEWVEEGPGGRTGVVIIDFPGSKLVNAVIRRNDGLKS
ncbi:related to 1-phosphatidylinositol phosphodiesterase precursor [Cephalotrichum gorgonifer]|uniref:Related to 1-phosphatidylinositol phosphodiesterase n=1 Tax=Cephalotrichum gorgonifer TaxID=2041049 RepID=A0AAE8SYF5_9PEZI|nr:related to 1-phosphatidylinositol phosphodiesterase precursor [Cephalotrichum gorgonifer]